MGSVNRRSFLKSTLAASAVGAAPFNILKAGSSPNSKLNIAYIGVGMQGSGNAAPLRLPSSVFCPASSGFGPSE